ncbi:MAG: hypothetical protein ACO23N_06615 [Opitutales bacterium]
MGRPVRILLWTCSALALLAVAALVVVDLQLEASRLGPRVTGLLADAGIGGSFNRIEASVDGAFSAEGVDLTLADGTRVRAESVRGDIGVLQLLTGHVHLANLEGKGIDITLVAPTATTAPATPEVQQAPADLGLGRFSTGPLALSGKLLLADGTLLRFNLRSEGVDPSGQLELRAGLAWPGRSIGAATTDPRAELVATATFARTLGAHGTGWRALADDIAKLRVRLNTRDAGALAAGGPQIEIDAATGASGLEGKLVARDAKGLAALEGAFTLGESLALKGKVNLSTADLGVLTPSQRTQICRVRGEIAVGLTPQGWQGTGDLAATWDDLSVFSRRIAAGTRGDWKARLAAQGDAAGWSIDAALVEGPGGVTLRINKPLRWRGGALPADSSGAPIEIAASDAPLSALAPFLAPTGLVPVGGTWSVGAEIAFAEGEAILTCPRAASVSGLEVERDGKPLLGGLNLTLPLRADRGGIAIQGFQGGVDGRTLLAGDVSVRPGENGAWQADLRVRLDLGDLAGQPGWENIPFDRLRGITVDLTGNVAAKANATPVATASSAVIRKGNTELLTLRQRVPINLDGALPTGALFEAKAAELPLESVSALVPGLGLTGTLTRADLTLGARSDGSWYVRSEAGPLRFADTGVAWAGTPYLEHCDLTTEIDLSFGATSVLRFEKTDLRSRGRTLATGSATVPLGKGWPTATLQGELGALATQPFARALGQVAAGNYQASLAPKGAGSVSCEITVRDAGFRDRALRLGLARVAATLDQEGQASTVSGSFKIGAAGNSEGAFRVRTETVGALRRWDAKVDIAELALDDILGLAPPEGDPATDTAPNLAADRQPVWSGHAGALELSLAKGGLGELAVRELKLLATVEGDTAKLVSLTGKVMGGTLAGDGTLVFNRVAGGGPYALTSVLSIANLDLAQIASLVPTMRGNADGKAHARIGALARAPNLGQVPRNLALDLSLDADNGAIRMPSSAATLSKKIGSMADIGIGVAALTAAFGKGRNAEVAARVAVQGTALREIQKAAEDYRYSKLEVRAQRLADGSIRLSRAEVRGETLSLAAEGKLTALPGSDLLDCPIDITAQLRGSGTLGNCFSELGYDNGTPSADGQRQGPWFKVAGSINQIQTNLLDALLLPPDPTGGTAPAPVTPASPRRGTNLGDRLIERLGR